MNLNKVMIAGNLTRDPELRYTPKGTAVAELGLAINRVFTEAGTFMCPRRKSTSSHSSRKSSAVRSPAKAAMARQGRASARDFSRMSWSWSGVKISGVLSTDFTGSIAENGLWSRWPRLTP